MTGTNFEMADSEQALTPVNTNLFLQERYGYEISMLTVQSMERLF